MKPITAIIVIFAAFPITLNLIGLLKVYFIKLW